MLMNCPTCGSRFSLDAAVNDEAGRELMGILAKRPADLSRPLATYLGLFRSNSRALAWGRALKLSQEVLALGDGPAMAAALTNTVETLRERQQQPGWKPLRNHNYLKQVLETVEASVVVAAPVETHTQTHAQAQAPKVYKSQSAAGLMALQSLKE